MPDLALDPRHLDPVDLAKLDAAIQAADRDPAVADALRRAWSAMVAKGRIAEALLDLLPRPAAP